MTLRCPVFSGVPRHLHLNDFLKANGHGPDSSWTMGPVTVVVFKTPEGAVAAHELLTLYGWRAQRHGGMIAVSDRVEGHPFIDQRIFQHVFQQHLINDPEANYALYRQLIDEELKELDDAVTPEEHLDAIIDLLYVVTGAGNALGHDLQGAWNEVHKTNMAKAGPDGKPIIRADGKVIKPSDWVPPVLGRFVGHVLAKFRKTMVIEVVYEGRWADRPITIREEASNG